jgi:adenosylcobinamide-phosphate synthase
VVWLGKGVDAAKRVAPRGGIRDLVSGIVIGCAFPSLAFLGMFGARRLLLRCQPVTAFATEALLLKQCFAVRSLFEHVRAVANPLERGGLEAARAAVSHVVSRDTSSLDEAGIASAAIETLAENASDSAVAAWFWYVVGGLPAAAAFRAVNTLDAMVGYRSEGLFGMPSARADDLANLLPARATALFLAATGMHPLRALTGARRDARSTPSPNSGWPMATAAYQLGVRLEKQGYHVLNPDGRDPDATDLTSAIALASRALLVVAAVCITLAWIRREAHP